MAAMDLLGDDVEPPIKVDKGKGKARDQGEGITINSSFAQKYEHKKRGEELSKRASVPSFGTTWQRD